MKNLIVLCAVLLLLMTFPVQYALNIRNHYRVSLTQKYVNNAKEQARQIGYFSDDIVMKLRENISSNTKIDMEDIKIDVTNLVDRKTRGQLLHYKVQIPLYCLVAAPTIWGIDEEDNYGVYVVENDAVSEWLMP